MSTLDPSTAAFTPAAQRHPAPLERSCNAEAGPSTVKVQAPTAGQKRAAEELGDLLGRESAGTRLQRLANHAPVTFNPVCRHTTSANCTEENCTKTHFEPLIRPYTDPSLGHCSYLNLCYGDPLFARNPSLGAEPPRSGQKDCRYLHFHVEPSPAFHALSPPQTLPPSLCATISTSSPSLSRHKQWINCDLRSFDYSILGQYQVIMADPPWDIHMSLPYGTMTDDELRRLPIPSLQPDWGILALWVTGRAMELGRELLDVWGYRRVDEVIWVKVNQLQRLIRTGRTGHWLNHTCEHLLVAVKVPSGFPTDKPIPWLDAPELRALRRPMDTDVIVAEVRETSRKPDEVYHLLDRLCPHGRKLELFGRRHNFRDGWLTLGNQLEDSQLADQELIERFKQRYPGQHIHAIV